MGYRLSSMVLPAALAVFIAASVQATTIDTVPVGNPGNAGELSGASAPGGYGPDRICGAVDYSYNIGKTEVTAGQYAAFLNAVAKASDTYGLYNTDMGSSTYGCKIQQGGTLGNYTYTVTAGYENRPVNYVGFWDACRFTNWLHNGQQGADTTETGAYTLTATAINNNRIVRNADWKWAVTSEDEWYKAAYYDPNKTGGSGYWDYPTKSNTAPGRDMTELTNSGNNANIYGTPYPIDSGKYTTIAGKFLNSASPYGTFDQGGNLWEWNETVIGSTDSGLRGVRGGSFNMGDYYLLASCRDNLGYPYREENLIGFRVVSVPEPSTIALLGMGTIGLLGWAWRKRKA